MTQQFKKLTLFYAFELNREWKMITGSNFRRSKVTFSFKRSKSEDQKAKNCFDLVIKVENGNLVSKF